MSAFFAGRRSAQADAEPQQTVTVLPAGNPVGFDTVIGAESETEGKFRSAGNVRMDGKFSGSLDIDGNILIGESAEIQADINARNISIAGAVRGNVQGSKVQLLRTGRIWGDIRADSLTTEEGAFIEGKISMLGHAAADEPASDYIAATSATDDLPTDNADSVSAVDDADADPDSLPDAS